MRVLRPLLLLPLAAALAAALAACNGWGEPAPPQHDVLIVTFDTLRADRLGAYGNDDWGRTPSPHVDALAARGVLFESAMAPRGQTHPSLASMLTGKYPITTGLRDNGMLLLPHHVSILQHLQEAGFRTGAFVANFDLTDPFDSWVYRGADVAGDGPRGNFRAEVQNESRFQAVWDDRVEESAMQFLDGLEPGKPFAAWVHFYDVHKPYTPPAAWRDYGASDDVPAVLKAPGPSSGAALEQHLRAITLGQREVPAAELRRILGLYDGGVSATDVRLGRLLDKLRALGREDRTFLVFTADHGEELFDHNRYFFHGASIYQGVLRLPLVIAGPGLPAGARVGATVQNIDIAPTLLDLLGLPPSPEMEGRSLAGLLRGETSEPPRPYAFMEWQNLVYCVTDGRLTYVHNPLHAHLLKEPYVVRGEPAKQGFRVNCFEAYDLSTDPLEQRDLLADVDPATLGSAAGLPPELAPLRRALDQWLADPRHERELTLPGWSSEQIERERKEKMEALGYVGGADENTDSRLGGRRYTADFLLAEPCSGER